MKIFKDGMRLPAEFPFRIISQTLKKEDNCRNSYHWHDFCEISHIRRGSGSYFLNGARFPVKEGDILIFNSAQLHGWMVTEEDMELTVIMFSAALLNLCEEEEEAWEGGLCSKKGKEDEITCPVKALLEAMEKEYNGKEPGSHLAIRAGLLNLIVLLLRSGSQGAFKKGLPPVERQNSMVRLENAINYINRHYAERITLESAAKAAFMNANYFSSYFKRMAGMGFQEYLIRYRLEKAEELKQGLQRSVAEAAVQSGFHNLSNYYRLYKKYLGGDFDREEAGSCKDKENNYE